jgi:hypothetical protein
LWIFEAGATGWHAAPELGTGEGRLNVRDAAMVRAEPKASSL